MASVAAKRRRKKARGITGATTPDRRDQPTTAKDTTRPTPERWKHGIWAEASGAGSDARPLVDLAADMVGRLYAEGKLTTSQHEAARRFQELREAFMGELGTPGYRSCLAGGSGGYDSGDGDAAVIQKYRAVSGMLGRVHLRALVDNVHKLSDERVTDLTALKAALDELGK